MSKDKNKMAAEQATSAKQKKKKSQDSKINDTPTTLAQELANDNATWLTYFNQPHQIDGNEPAGLSQQRKEIVERALSLIEPGSILFKNKEKDDYQNLAPANKNVGLSVFNVVSHGGRVFFELPKLTTDDENPYAVLNWIFNGDPTVAVEQSVGGLSDEAAKAQGKPAYRRQISTHDTKSDKEGNITEVKLHSSNPRNWGKFLIDLIASEAHFGVNLGLGSVAEAGPENGSHGHMYIHFMPPTKDKKGSLMLGFETSEPGKKSAYGHSHDIRGNSGVQSLTGGHKFRHEIFKDSPIQPAAINGVRVNLDKEFLQKITSQRHGLDIEAFSKPITEADVYQNLFAQTQDANAINTVNTVNANTDTDATKDSSEKSTNQIDNISTQPTVKITGSLSAVIDRKNASPCQTRSAPNEEFEGKTSFSFLRPAEDKTAKIKRTTLVTNQKIAFDYECDPISLNRNSAAYWANKQIKDFKEEYKNNGGALEDLKRLGINIDGFSERDAEYLAIVCASQNIPLWYRDKVINYMPTEKAMKKLEKYSTKYESKLTKNRADADINITNDKAFNVPFVGNKQFTKKKEHLIFRLFNRLSRKPKKDAANDGRQENQKKVA